MKEVIIKVPSFSADYPKAPIYVAELVRCGECIYWKNSLCQAWHRVIPKDGYCSIGERDGSTQTETQNSNLTFETLEYCDICDHKGCEECIANALDEHCIPSQFKKQIEDECAKEYEELGLKELKELIEADHKTENCSEKPNNCEHITEDGVTCAKYPACDDCLDNPLNKVKGSERLVKGKDEPQMGDAKPIPLSNRVTHIEDEPQTYITEDRDTQILDAWQVHHRSTTSVEDEPQTDCDHKCIQTEIGCEKTDCAWK